MGVSLIVDTTKPSVERDENDYIQYQHRVDPSDSDWGESDDEWYIRALHPDHPVGRAMDIAASLRMNCNSFLAKAGIVKPKLSRHYETGKCTACGEMEGFISSFANIELGATAGCPSCDILVQAVRMCTPKKRALLSSKLLIMDAWNSGCAGRQFIQTKNVSSELPGAMGVIAGLDASKELKYMFTKEKDIPSEILMEMNLFGVQGDPASWSNIGMAYHISGDTSSDIALQWFEDRLGQCIQNHFLCKTPFSNGQLPDRILDLGPGPGGFPDLDGDVRLIESKGRRGRYVCLSYCWGGTIEIRTLMDRYESYKNGISWETLPQGYRDAIHLTRQLGIRYIWIDSLCIIQDNEADWKDQASKMASIYQGSHVTIAATKACSPSEGYFSVSPPQYHATRLTHTDEHGKTYSAYARRTIPHFFSSSAASEPNFSLDRAPLLRRGWVFQERLLAPRILHLGEVEMVWECNEACACECMGTTQTYSSEPRWAHTKGSHARNLATATESGGGDVSPDWRSTVEHYTRTNLSFDKDIFPAISGVVKNMQRYRDDRYLAGVWENSVLDDLAWHATNSLLPRPETWLAPTWSWASVKSRVCYLNYRTMLSSEYVKRTEPQTQRTVLIEASVTPVGIDPTAEVCQGHITLYGPIIAASLMRPDDLEEERHYYHARHGTTLMRFFPDYDLAASGPGFVPVGSQISVLFLCQEPALKSSGLAAKRSKTKVFSLVLRRVSKAEPAEGSIGTSASHGQLERDCSGVPLDGTFERIGIFIDSLDTTEERCYVEELGEDCVVKII